MISSFRGKSVLVVVAHPDDEVLGCGGLISKISNEGVKVNLCILSGKVNKRSNKPSNNELLANIKKSSRILGINQINIGEFPNLSFNTVPHFKLVEFIEDSILKTKSNIVITHHSNDLNVDHRYTSLACQTAIKI